MVRRSYSRNVRQVDHTGIISIVRAVQKGFGIAGSDGDFDLLYFARIMEEFLRDRERLARALMGDFGEDKAGWGS